jgi:hypothetical protein
MLGGDVFGIGADDAEVTPNDDDNGDEDEPDSKTSRSSAGCALQAAVAAQRTAMLDTALIIIAS